MGDSTGAKMGIVYDEGSSARQTMKKEGKPNSNKAAISDLPAITFDKRTKTKIMHNKFLVAGKRSPTHNIHPDSSPAASVR